MKNFSKIYWGIIMMLTVFTLIFCGITITESAKVATLTLDQTVTYDAPENIPVTLDANGGSFGCSPSREVIIKLSDVLGSSDILSNLPTRAGYTLSGWKYSKDNITFYTYDSNTEFPFTDHLYLQAQWTISTYTVTMLRNNDNYGTLSPSSSLTIGYGASITISGNTITFGATDGNVATTVTATPSSAIGYTTTFTSWDNVSGTITANRSVTATFTRTANTYSIAYAGMDGATHGEYHPTSATYGTPFTVSNPSKAGYSFTGWNISNMDTVSHTIGESSSSATTLSSVTATTFSNLRSTSGTVTFTATWEEATGLSLTIVMNIGYARSAHVIVRNVTKDAIIYEDSVSSGYISGEFTYSFDYGDELYIYFDTFYDNSAIATKSVLINGVYHYGSKGGTTALSDIVDTLDNVIYNIHFVSFATGGGPIIGDGIYTKTLSNVTENLTIEFVYHDESGN